MAFHIWPTDALFSSRTAEPVGARSLSDGEINQLYQYWLNRPPDSTEFASEVENSWKYSAAAIERQIALRAGNVASSGVRGDEGAGSLTVAAPPPLPVDSHAGSVAAIGPAAIVPASPGGPVALQSGPYPYPVSTAGFGGFGNLSIGTIAIVLAMAGAVWFLVKGRH